MNIYLHIHGRGDPKKYLIWMGNGPDDGMHNWRLLAERRDNDLDVRTHLTMIDITDAVTPHLDLIASLNQDDPFRSESLYAALFLNARPRQPPICIIVRAADVDAAEVEIGKIIDSKLIERGVIVGAPLTELDRHPDFLKLLNLGEGLAILKHKIGQYFGKAKDLETA